MARKKIINQKIEKVGILILDEIQKIPDRTTTVKKLYDEDTRTKTPLK